MNSLKNIIARTLKRIIAHAQEPPKDVNKILVIREAAIGDVLCMTPFLKSLREFYPRAKIEYVVVDWAKGAVQNNPNIDKIHVVTNDLISGNKIKAALKRLQFFSKLAKNNYDLIFYPTTQLLYKIALLPFRKSYKIGFGVAPKNSVSNDNFMLNDYVFIDLNEIPRTRHIAVRNLEMLDLIAGKKVGRDYGLEIFPTEANVKQIDTLTESLGWKNCEIIAMAPSAGNALKSDAALKTAPKEKFIEILKKLKKENTARRFALIGAKSEQRYAESMNIADGKNVINLCGKLSLTESAEFLRRCSLLISNDSGATHIASALKMNHIVFFGATDEIEFGPYQNPNAKVYRVPLPCAPCRADKCNVPETEEFKGIMRPFCLNKIDTEKVVEYATQQISNISFFQTR
jgi:heptosyltransferase II